MFLSQEYPKFSERMIVAFFKYCSDMGNSLFSLHDTTRYVFHITAQYVLCEAQNYSSCAVQTEVLGLL
jgi:hypothetical protein